jgi:hypothetical protein
MTLLERFDNYGMGASLDEMHPNEIRRAIAVSQAVDERVEIERARNADCRSEGVNWIMRRADELLRGKP